MKETCLLRPARQDDHGKLSMTRVPKIEDYSPELREEIAKADALAQRAKEAERRALELQGRLQSGPSKEERVADAERAAKGEPLADLDLDARYKAALREFHALQDAQKIQQEKVDSTKREAARKLCVEVVDPIYQTDMKRLAPLLSEVYSLWHTIFWLRRGLVNQGLPIYVTLGLEPDFLGIPDGTSDLEVFLRQCVRAGYLRSLPKELAR